MNFVDFLCFLLTDSDVNAKILEGIANQFHKKGKMGSTLEPHLWRNSKAQQVILGLLKSGHIWSEMTSKTEIEQIWNMYCVPRQEFAGFQFSKFPPRLKAMQKSHAAHIGHAKVETEILRVHKQHFPTPLRDHRGHPQWHGSDAERFLKADIAARTPGETPIAPKLFYLTRAAYQIYPLDVFRKHIHQELRLRKLIYQYCNRKVHDDTTTNDSL